MDRLELSWKIIIVAGFLGFVTGLWFMLIRSSIIIMPSDIAFANISSSELRNIHPELFRWMGYVFATFGAFISGLSLLTIWIAMTAYRRKEKWAWCALLTTDVLALSASLVNVIVIGSDMVIIVAPLLFGMVAALALTFKDFFKRCIP